MGIDQIDVDYEITEETEDFGSDKNKSSHQSTLAFMESIDMPQINAVQEVVISADVRCVECQKRVVDMISRFNETESVVVNLSEKKVVITCKYLKAPKKQLIIPQKNPFSKIALVKRFFGSKTT